MTLSANLSPNLIILPSFVSQDLMPDGIHLTPVSGLHFVLHLFDQTDTLLALEPARPEVKLAHVQESVRHHGDRLSFLESRHGQLMSRVDLKMARDAEFDDWVTNRTEEDWVTILGLKRLGRMSGREWQVAAKAQVKEFFKYVLHLHHARLDFTVLYVGNPVRQRTTGGTVLNVKLDSVASSQRLRDLYSGFFRKENPVNLPRDLRGISLRNKVTLATRIRIEILRVFASNHLAANPGSSVAVHGFESRPKLVTFPARNSTDPSRTYNFIEAVTLLPATFSDDGLAQIFKVVGARFVGELRSLFVVLDDDDRDRCLELAKTFSRPIRGRGSAPSGGSAGPSASATSFGVTTGSGAGRDDASAVLHSLRSPPPPPPPRSESHCRSRSPRSESRRRSRSPRDERRRRSSSSPEERRSKKSTRSKRTRRSSSSSGSSSDHRSKKRKGSSKSKGGTKSSRKSRASSSSSGSETSMAKKSSKK